MKIKRDTRKLKESDTSEDDLYAMLAVLSKSDEGSDSCPSAKDLTDFSEGRLRGRKQKEIIRHLNQCTQCRRQWIRLGAALDALSDPNPNRFERFMNKLKAIKLNYAIVGGGCGAALACFLLLFFVAADTTSLDTMIAGSFADLSPSQAAHFNSFVSKGENTNSEQYDSKALQAYRQGLIAAKRGLLKDAESLFPTNGKDREQALFIDLGYWAVLLQCACLSSEASSAGFWSDQQTISAEFQAELQHTGKTEADLQKLMTAVTAIQTAIQQIRKTEIEFIGCKEIIFEINNLENILRSSGL
jgi:hypothetical protein